MLNFLSLDTKNLVLGESLTIICRVQLASFKLTCILLCPYYQKTSRVINLGYVSPSTYVSSGFSIEVSLERHYTCRFDLILNHFELMFNLFSCIWSVVSLRDTFICMHSEPQQRRGRGSREENGRNRQPYSYKPRRNSRKP